MESLVLQHVKVYISPVCQHVKKIHRWWHLHHPPLRIQPHCKPPNIHQDAAYWLQLSINHHQSHPTDIKLWTLQLPLAVDQGHPESQTPGSQSSNIIFNAGAPQGCVLRPLLFMLFMHETPYTEEVQVQLTWCSDNHLFIDIVKATETLMKFWKSRTRLQSLEKSWSRSQSSCSSEITSQRTWVGPGAAPTLLKKAQQHLFFLRTQRRNKYPPCLLKTYGQDMWGKFDRHHLSTLACRQRPQNPENHLHWSLEWYMGGC